MPVLDLLRQTRGCDLHGHTAQSITTRWGYVRGRERGFAACACCGGPYPGSVAVVCCGGCGGEYGKAR